MRRQARDLGSVTVELVVLTPLFVILSLFAVFAGRATEGLTAVRHAADQGARAASKVAIERMELVGRAAALEDLRNRRVSCVDPQISVVPGDGGRTITVSIECSSSANGLGLLDASSPTVQATSTEVIDVYRGGNE